ncbi:RagB/SusD family nutrient uptake outer membrane protein [Poritiphilus flavus]|uniref:RagB/SusD family nutrient uptake outer membrane protein n=1 Tax=Poritiphilus flavus TaxID=2697053 RepID=A0A6L9EIA4_9FLAO|nr:RagB/SusD family nutrient uptake outer membrane protein [Poritiphilus flavus]NAS14402.1 RagB/SusD family nutrient uptake outer membrane protein [Poritiphilus flavus]
MKNRIIKILLVVLTLGFFACDDELNELQPFIEGNPETFFNSLSTFQNGVDGIYSQLVNYYANPGSGMQGIPDILSDNVVLVQTGRTSNEDYYDYRYVPNTAGALQLYWSECYEAINVANLVIGQIDNLADGPEKDNILGQALAARAYAHFDLARTYAKIPSQSGDANGSPGIVYLKVEDGDTGDPFAQPSRETVGSNYAEIIGDLETAAQIIGTGNGEGRLDRNGVYGILSRVYLYNGEYQKAIDAANQVTTQLATASELEDVFTDVSSAGLVFELAINTSTETTNNNVGVLYSQSSADAVISEYAIEFEFWSSIDPDDLRRNVLQFVGTNQGNDYNAVKKFLGEAGQVNGRVDIKVIRAAEVLLNKAEAQFELGQEAAALASLDELRAQRFASFVSGGETGQALEDAIQFNRRVELAFEGHRFFDLKRRGENIERSTAGDIIDGSGTPAEVQTLSAGDTRFQLPIPLSEINANPNMEQNDGY